MEDPYRLHVAHLVPQPVPRVAKGPKHCAHDFGLETLGGVIAMLARLLITALQHVSGRRPNALATAKSANVNATVTPMLKNYPQVHPTRHERVNMQPTLAATLDYVQVRVPIPSFVSQCLEETLQLLLHATSVGRRVAEGQSDQSTQVICDCVPAGLTASPARRRFGLRLPALTAEGLTSQRRLSRSREQVHVNTAVE
jgi:hypothetical protein